MSQSTQQLASNLAERAQAILDDEAKYSHKDIMASAFSDFKSLGSMSGILAVMSTGKLNAQQVELAKRLATKVIAIVSQYEETT